MLKTTQHLNSLEFLLTFSLPLLGRIRILVEIFLKRGSSLSLSIPYLLIKSVMKCNKRTNIEIKGLASKIRSLLKKLNFWLNTLSLQPTGI